eukprot:11280274-Prorocentrum_lima.AAC.1
MTSSLVGSEMCIRDRVDGFRQAGYGSAVGNMAWISGAKAGSTATPESVSYTHLTLPTICSV